MSLFSFIKTVDSAIVQHKFAKTTKRPILGCKMGYFYLLPEMDGLPNFSALWVDVAKLKKTLKRAVKH